MSQEGGTWCLMVPTPPGTPMGNILAKRIDRQPLFLNICGSVTAPECLSRKFISELVTTLDASGRKPVSKEARLGPQNGNLH